MSQTKKKAINLNKRAHSKVNIPSSYSYNTFNQTKILSAESPLNNNLSKDIIPKSSKIYNISTKINSTSNSNFNDNLYYYPPHNKNFSYMNNLSSEVELIYGDFNFMKAPTLRQNLSGIKKIINERKISKQKYLDNLFSMTLAENKISKNISPKNKNDDIIKHLRTFNKLSRNNSCGEINKTKDNDKYKMENLKNPYSKYTNTNTHNKFFTSYNATMSPDETKTNYNEKLESTNINAATTYHETTKLPNILKSKRKNKEENLTSKKNMFYKSNSFILTNLNTIKFNIDINNCIFESKRKIKNICDFTKKVLCMKIFQAIQKKALNSFIDKNFNQLRKYIEHIEANFEKYTQICKIFNYNHSSYLKFLKITIVKMDEENKSLNGQIMKLNYEIEEILTANVRAQKELETLIDMRNFIYRVRHKDEQIPDIYSTFYIESKRFLLAKLFIKLYKNHSNLTVMKYLIDIPDEIPEINNFDQSKFYVQKSPPLFNAIQKKQNIENKNKNKKNKKKLDEPNTKTFFTSDDEFIDIFKSSEEYNRALLRKNRIKLDLIEKYKEKLENLIPPEDIKSFERYNKIIKINEKELLRLKQNNLMLNTKYMYYYNKVSKEHLFQKKEKSSSKKDDDIKSSFQDLTYFQTINYNKLIKKAKYPGLIFFRKLLKSYLNFSKLNTDENFYNKTHPDYLEEIIHFSQNAEDNPKYFFYINKYTLQILQLYEYICDYIYKKYHIYKLEEKNLAVIKQQKYLINEKRKLDNARTLRKLLDKKRYDSNKQLIQKWLMPQKYIGKGTYVSTYCRNLVRAKSRENMLKKKNIIKIKNNFDNDLNEFL